MKGYNFWEEIMKPICAIIALLLMLLACGNEIVRAEDEVVELKVISWGLLKEWGITDGFEAYAKAKGFKVKLAYIKPFLVTLPDCFELLRSGKGDMAIPVNFYYKSKSSQLFKVLMPIDYSRIPNFRKVWPVLKQGDFVDYHEKDGKGYGVPIRADIQTLYYNIERVKDPPVSWKALFDPKYKGRLGLFGTQHEANVGITLLALGYSTDAFYDASAEKINWQELQQALIKVVKNAHSWYDISPKNCNPMLINRYYDLFYAMGNTVFEIERKGYGKWKAADMAEGGQIWVDEISFSSELMNEPKNLEAAYLFADYLLSDEVQTMMYTRTGYAPVTRNIAEKLRIDFGDKPYFYESFYKKDFLMQPMGSRSFNLYNREWFRAVKAAGRENEPNLEKWK
jgi:spermidine/putrescine-binding protein